VRFDSSVPFPLLVEVMASPVTDMGATFRQNLGRGGPYAPKHYLMKLHAKYVGKDAADKLAADNKLNGWAANFKFMSQFQTNPALPTVYPWIVKTGTTDPTTFVIERNPYSIWVDTDGNQLPYIGTVQHVQVSGTDVMLLKAGSGDLDFMELQFTIAQLPVLVQNADRGQYKVYLDPEQTGVGILPNLAYNDPNDKEIGDLIRTTDFRRALSMAINRDAVNETFFLGTGVPQGPCCSSDSKYYPGDDAAKKWSQFDVAQANALLDKLGLTQKDSAGYRLKKDGKQLAMTFMAVDRLIDQAQFAEMLKGFWKAIGVNLTAETVSSALAQQRIGGNQAMLTINTVGTEEPYLNPGFQTPVGGGFSAMLGVPYGQWINSGGKQGTAPFAEMQTAVDMLEKGKNAATAAERVKIGQDLSAYVTDQVFLVGLVSGDLTQGIRIAKNTMGNIPGRFYNTSVLLTPVTAMPQTYYFK
jgi:peptide/nickel transport system substrate-binding protein